jgi:GrpB-like predicted nucleotidyltransferase (UPF0157 family)
MTSVPDEPIHVAPYDESWPDQFRSEQAVLLKSLEEWLTGPIEHVGSTAVPGLAAKPVIDIMAGVESLKGARPAISVLEKIEYCHFPYHAESMHWFCKPSPSFRTHHLHLVPFQSTLWVERLAFRDYLRTHAEVAREYATLKYRLADQHRFDREAYTEAKGSFVKRVVKVALQQRP